MGLEAANFISQLIPTNPASTDKKNEGDNHLRLIKSVLQQTFPNASRPVRFSNAIFTGANVNVDITHENTLFFVHTGVPPAGTRILVLPSTIPPAGWTIWVVMYEGSFGVAQVKSPVPWANRVGGTDMFIYPENQVVRITSLATTYLYTREAGEAAGTILMHAGAIPIGYQSAIGQSLPAATNPELFGAWGTFWGSAGAGFFNAPDLRDRFPVATGGAYGLNSTGGANTVAIDASQMPNHNHPIFISDPAHGHGITGQSFPLLNNDPGSVQQVSGVGFKIGITTLSISASGTGISASSGAVGGNAAHENRPPFTGLHFMYRLG